MTTKKLPAAIVQFVPELEPEPEPEPEPELVWGQCGCQQAQCACTANSESCHGKRVASRGFSASSSVGAATAVKRCVSRRMRSCKGCGW